MYTNYTTKIIKLDIKNGKYPIKIERGTPVFLAHDMPRTPSKMGACGYVIGVNDGKAIVYIQTRNTPSRDLVSVLDHITEDQLVVHNSRVLYVLDRDCDVTGI